MNKTFYIFFLLFLLDFCCEIKSQTNLIYNGDFEQYSSCPNTISTPGNIEMTKCVGWTNPTDATPDYFNTCNNSINNVVGIPYNNVGFQYSKSGNGYMGLIPFEFDGISYWYEYIQGVLTSQLIKDKWYDIVLYVSLADGYADIAIKNLGVYLSQNSFSISGSNKLNYIPQFTANFFITDTLNWVKVEGKIKSTGGESYITIGYFDNITNDSLRVNNLPPSGVSSYYYIDGLELHETSDSISKCTEVIPTVFTPNNDSINDILKFNLCNNVLKFTIYNRWGNLMFESDKSNPFWDGRTTSGEQCADGNYFYVITTEEKTYKGFVQLIR